MILFISAFLLALYFSLPKEEKPHKPSFLDRLESKIEEWEEYDEKHQASKIDKEPIYQAEEVEVIEEINFIKKLYFSNSISKYDNTSNAFFLDIGEEDSEHIRAKLTNGKIFGWVVTYEPLAKRYWLNFQSFCKGLTLVENTKITFYLEDETELNYYMLHSNIPMLRTFENSLIVSVSDIEKLSKNNINSLQITTPQGKSYFSYVDRFSTESWIQTKEEYNKLQKHIAGFFLKANK